MRVLHLCADWKWTGPAEPMLNAVTGLRALGHLVDLGCADAPPGYSGGLAERARARGVEPVHRLTRRHGYVPLRDAGEVRRLRRFLAAQAYDLVHVHHTRDHFLAWRALPDPATRLVASWHHGEPPPAGPFGRWLYGPRRLAGLVLLSESLAEAARTRLGWPAARLAVAPGGVDAEHFAPLAADPEVRDELGLKPADCVVGVVARLQPHRRYELLLEALRRARQQAPELRLVVVGRGTRAKQVIDEPLRKLELGDAVVRAGYRRADFRAVLSQFDALVFLVPGSEGSCRAVLEAMAMEIPTIASRRGLLPELVDDGQTGRLVDEDPDALAAALIDLARQPDAWRARGRAARKRVLARHRIETLAGSLDALYRKLSG